MIFSIKNTIYILFNGFHALEYSAGTESHDWQDNPFDFEISIPRKYYTEDQALNRAKVWLYEIMLEEKLKKKSPQKQGL